VREAYRLRTAFFGRTNEPLSVRGLEVLLGLPGITVVSVTCGRANATYEENGDLHRTARVSGITLLDPGSVADAVSDLDVVVSCSNPVIFPPAFIESVRWGVVNVHPAPLPRYRGCHGLEHALLEGASDFGVTLHFCEGSLDAGPVIDECLIPIDCTDSSRTMWQKVDEACLTMLTRTVPRIVDAARTGRRVAAREQDPRLARYFAHSSLPPELELDLSDPLLFVRQVRAYDHPRRRPGYLRSGDHVLRFRFSDGRVVLDGIEEFHPPGGHQPGAGDDSGLRQSGSPRLVEFDEVPIGVPDEGNGLVAHVERLPGDIYPF
jgi:methionyl-tRNA formyltransferase